MQLTQFRFHLTLTAPLCMALLVNACVSSETDDPAEDGGSGGASSTSSTTGNSSTTTSASTSTTGSSGSGGGVNCAEMTSVSTELMTDFETYDGATEAVAYEFNFNGDEAGVGAVYAGLFELTDMTGAYALSFVAGANDSSWALSFANGSASDWGGGVGFWHGCMDVSSFTGVQFMMRGATPVGTAGMSLTLPNDVSVSSEFQVPADWTLVQLPFTSFSSDTGDTTNGSQIGGMSFQAHMVYVQDSTGEWVPEPGAYEVAIDDLGFY